MKRWLAVLALAVAACIPVAHATAQQETQQIKVQWDMSDSVRSYLEAEWDRYAKDPNQVERAYCMGGKAILGDDSYYFLLNSIAPATVTAPPTAYSIHYYCPATSIEIHVHTPNTCRKGKPCQLGGPDAWLCYPSPTDQNVGEVPGFPLSFLQCDRDAFVPYLTNRHMPTTSTDHSDPPMSQAKQAT